MSRDFEVFSLAAFSGEKGKWSCIEIFNQQFWDGINQVIYFNCVFVVYKDICRDTDNVKDKSKLKTDLYLK